ncbi:PAS domain S-box protein [Natrialbaceae archaeon GCM10025810]|uniref:PAS domain S-box protein n=1 Tax=Halovalidus salilacus TaxID=3075124 RepID=UPI003613F5A0
MNQPRVLCVSGDRSTRASVTLSLLDAPVNVGIAQSTEEAVERIEREPIDAVVVDASTVEDVPCLVDAIESRDSDTPTFVHWGEEGDDVAVLTEVIARASRSHSSDRLADAVTDRIDFGPERVLDRLVATVRQRLVDATTTRGVERSIREAFVLDDRFEFAWLGEYDRGEREVVPWLTDPSAVDWPLGRTFSIGDGSQPLLERTMRTEEVQQIQHLGGNPDAVPLGRFAFDRGVQAVAVAPLASEGELYGVLAVYANRALSSTEREAIRSVAKTASHVLETVAARGRLEQLERSVARYERLVETAGDGMYVVDEQGHFTTINDALIEMTGYSREGLLGEHVSILLDDEDVAYGTETIRTLLSEGRRTDTIELTLLTKDGREIPTEAKISVLVHDGAFHGSVGVVRDITERKRRERTLREQNERLDAFARIVSHDLRNPLGVAQGYLDLLEQTGSREHIENVRDGLSRMEAIIADVLAIARDGEWAVDPEPVDLESVVGDAWEHVDTSEATLEVTVDEGVTVEADRSRFLRLLENLFRNAVEHGSTNPRSQAHEDAVEHGGESVTIRIGTLRGNSGRTGFYVEDDGSGLPEEIRDEVFDQSVSMSSEGLGIGLWIVREVATGHGWSVTATESEEGGARFEFDVTATTAVVEPDAAANDD